MRGSKALLAIGLGAALLACEGGRAGDRDRAPGGAGGAPGGSGGEGGGGHGGGAGGAAGAPGGTGGETPDPVCGNGVVEAGEACDGDDDRCGPDCRWSDGACDGAVDFVAGATVEGGLAVLTSDTGRRPSMLQGICGGEGPERVFELRFDGPTHVRWAVTDPSRRWWVNLASYAIVDCDPSAPLHCANPGAWGEAELPFAGTLQIVVDGPGDREAVDFALAAIRTPLRLAGETCDAVGGTDRCAAGLLCATLDGRSSCMWNGAPVLASATATWADAGRSRMTIAVEGTDEQGNAEGIWLRLLDQAGLPVIHDGGEVAGTWPVREPIAGRTAFRGTILLEGFDQVPPFARLEVAIEDTLGWRSNVLLVAPVDPIGAE